MVGRLSPAGFESRRDLKKNISIIIDPLYWQRCGHVSAKHAFFEQKINTSMRVCDDRVLRIFPGSPLG